MWAVGIENERTFEKVLGSFKNVVPYQITTSGTGATIAVAPRLPDKTPDHPHFFLVEGNTQRAKHAISWVHKNLHPQIFISSGLTDDWRTSSTEDTSFIPLSCLRSAGRIDMGGGPILYEEINFDPWVQNSLSKHASPLKNTSSKTFGSDREIVKDSEKQWLASHLNCQSYDTFSGELLLAGKRLGIRVGCIKFFDSDSKSLQSIVDFWNGFRIPT
jgi:hypothetical protein